MRTKGSGSRCCRSNTVARTPTSKRWPTGSTRTSSWASCGSPISASCRAAPRGVSAAKPRTFARSGRELGARYVMEGSLRQAGSTLRVAVQLVDATTGAHLWAETYDRAFSPDAMFALQDDLVPRIVSTVADWYGVLPHSMSEAVRLKPLDQLTPYEALLRSFGYFERVVPDRACRRAVRVWSGPSSRRRAMPRSGRCCRCCTGRNIASGSTPRPIRSGVHCRPRGGRWRPRPPVITRISRWRRRSSSARNSMPSATRPSEPSRSTRWTGPAWSTWATCWRLPATGSGAASWRRRRGISIRITRRGIGPFPSSTPIAKADYVTARAFMLKADMPGAVLLRGTPRGRVRPAGRSRGGGRERASGPGAQARLPQGRPRGVCEVVPAGAGRTVDRGTAQGGPRHSRRRERRTTFVVRSRPKRWRRPHPRSPSCRSAISAPIRTTSSSRTV